MLGDYLIDPRDTAVQELQSLLASQFSRQKVTIEEIEDYVLKYTPFMHDSHLKKSSLKPLEERNGIEILSPRKRRFSYPDGTIIQFN